MLTNTITLDRKDVKKYGTSGALVLQTLYNEFGEIIPQNYELWEPLFRDFIIMSTVKSTITKLYKDKKIDIVEGKIYLTKRKALEDVPTILSIIGEEEEQEEEKPKKPREANETWKMAVALQNALGIPPELHNTRTKLREAKKFIAAGYTAEDIDNRFGKDGDWYKYESLGQQGKAPFNIEMIKKNIGKKYTGQPTTGNKPQETKSMWS